MISEWVAVVESEGRERGYTMPAGEQTGQCRKRMLGHVQTQTMDAIRGTKSAPRKKRSKNGNGIPSETTAPRDDSGNDRGARPAIEHQ